MRELTSAIGLSFICALGCAHGQDLKAAQACTRLDDDVSRLSCYDGALGRTKPPALAHAPPGSDADTRQAPANFGDNGKLHPHPHADAPKSITVQIQQVSSLAHGMFEVTLDNGEIWRTTQADSALEFKAHDSVTISRRWLGGYEMFLAGRNEGVDATRIK